MDNIGEDEELNIIKQKSDELERIYKNMEHIKRENVLFEAYLIRNGMDPNIVMNEDKDFLKAQQKGSRKKFETLSREQKYEIANQESDALKKNIEDGRMRSDSILETLKAILEETDMAITEIRKDAFDFQREILIGGENSRTGKIEAEKIEKYREEKLKQKDALINKYKGKKQSLINQILKTENQIKKKDEMGDDLKFIDFHQLQIDNKKYVKEIDEKNRKLLTLKSSTGKIVTRLINEKKRLNFEVEQGKKYQAEITEKKNNIKNLQEVISSVEEEKKKEYELLYRLRGQKERYQKAPQTFKYIKKKEESTDIQYQIKNLQRKIEIAMLSYEKARKFLNMPDFQNQSEYFANQIQEEDDSDSDKEDKKDKN